ncbi:MAG: hypothetical protein RL398_537, partial [Planctomycetota bacterium]
LSTRHLAAQQPPANGPQRVDSNWIAWTNATVVTKPGERLEGATIVARNGTILTIGKQPPPAGAAVIDCSGLTLYPGLVEPFLSVDVPAPDAPPGDAHWHPMVLPQRRALDAAEIARSDREALRKLGYTTVGIAPAGGIVKGIGAVALLDEAESGKKARILRQEAFAAASLQTGWGGHPNSEMGAISVLRQALSDGRWWRSTAATLASEPRLASVAPPASLSLQAIADGWAMPLWFDVRDELQAIRVQKVATEFERSSVIVGSGMEFRRIDALVALGAPVLAPLHFPDAPDVGTIDAVESASLRQLLTWEQAPTNAARLLRAGLKVAFTTCRNTDRAEARKNLQRAIACGLTPDQALAALTTVPAELLGVADRVGTIEPGKLANIVAVAGDLLDPEAKIRDVWVGGVRHRIDAVNDSTLDGSWTWTEGWPGAGQTTPPALRVDGDKFTVELAGEGDKPIRIEGKDGKRDGGTLTVRLNDKQLGSDAWLWLRLHREGEALVGLATRDDGGKFVLRAQRAATPTKPEAGDKDAKKTERYQPPSLTALATPLGGFSPATMPMPESVLIRGGTVWPSDGREPIVDGAVLLRDGKIAFVGKASDLKDVPPGTTVLDATGKHVTPGIIDCHSHTGISRGVNEGGEAVTSEVRIADVVDPDDINWYRQLAGGVTAVNMLHGSANAIGGQSATAKIRYGVASPDEMLLDKAPAGMKWALGENPRGANDGGRSTAPPRYPGTRMGVEALIRDRLAAAEAYARRHADYQALQPAERARTLPPRRDLELEALAEILAGTRRIHCHSYRQDEIFMLCGVAQEYGLKIGTFQHVLEGYKVADAIAANAVGASSFADWWGYKLEVQDAIPDSPAIMFEVGVNVSINSDSDEHARRLNTEAAKAVKYGGVPPHEALRFVTANPAIQLGIYDRTGSLTEGKDADVVLWSDDPMSYAARCEATWVDGRRLFDLATDRGMRERIAQERTRLIRKALAEPGGRRARPGDPRDAYWAAEDDSDRYCCRTHTLEGR